MKKIITVILAIVMIMSAFPLTAIAKTDNKLKTEQEAILVLRDNMVNRVTEFSVDVKSNVNPENFASLKDKIITSATSEEYYSEPSTGDYLYWSNRGVAVDGSVELGDGYYIYHLVFKPRYFTTAKQEKEFENKVDSIISRYKLTSKSTYEQIDFIYDYLYKNVSYDEANKLNQQYYLKHSAYAALINGKAVCQGYASTFYYFCKKLNIDCRIVANEEHGWNIVKLGNKYYNIDATLEGTASKKVRKNEYFLKGSKDFPKRLHSKKQVYDNSDFNKKYPIADYGYVITTTVPETSEKPDKVVTLSTPKFTTIKRKGNKTVVKWKKVSGVNKYQIQYSTSKNFKSSKIITVIKSTSTTIKKTKKGKKYYLRIRACKIVAGGKVHSKWSKTKIV